ncbi:uncharacterized protein LOC129601122 [Paramacrobiotus metropolitanus]|uniref:uncharacterized protein LOC129601122 n=1 Tax=Paramacrobiotus metropolitanus TaxID=2943436 RepID=UPI0024461AEA|nr:uncharacterized protein LOC129601122 [Paramacrobiotus metropolitanus]
MLNFHPLLLHSKSGKTGCLVTVLWFVPDVVCSLFLKYLITCILLFTIMLCSKFLLYPEIVVLFFVIIPDIFCTKCTVRISEININGPNERDKAHDAEFIELISNCAGPGITDPSGIISLHDYAIVMWRGGKTAHDPVEVQYVIKLQGQSFSKKSPLLVIAAPGLYQRLVNNTDVIQGGAHLISSDELVPKVESKNIHDAGFLDNGKKRTMGVAVYSNGVSLAPGDFLDARTANLEKLDDILLYHEHGSGKQFADIFFQGYELPGIDAHRFGLFLRDLPGKHERHEDKKADYALSYCCVGKELAKWPLAFKRTEMSPGLENKCDAPVAKFVLDDNIGSKVTVKNRCDPAELAREAKLPTEKPKTHHGKKKGTGLGNDTLDAVAQALLGGTDMSKTMDSLERQVSMLASVIGGLVSVGGIVIIVILTVYVRRKRRQLRAAGHVPLNPVRAPFTMDDDDDVR